jgi:hypothetical protein
MIRLVAYSLTHLFFGLFRKYNTDMAKKLGRPTRDPSGEPSKLVPIRLTDTERINYQKAAERCGQSLSEWIRERLDRAAKREAKEA